MWAPAGGPGGVRFRTIPKRGAYGILLVVLVVVAMAITAAILAWVVSREETEAESNQVAPIPPPPTPPVAQGPPPTTLPSANALAPPPTTPVPPPAPHTARRFYTLLEEAQPVGCAFADIFADKSKAIARCDSEDACKGYWHIGADSSDPGWYAIAKKLQADCNLTEYAKTDIHPFYQKEPLAVPEDAPGAAAAPTEVRWQRKTNLDTEHVGAFGTYQPSAKLATPNKNYTSMFRACTKNPSSDAPSCVYFASPYIAPTLCPPSTLTSDEFVPKVAAVGATATPTYGEPIPNVDGTKKPRPPACSYVGLLDETEAQERCSAEPKCVGYYKNTSKAKLEWVGNFVLNAFGVAHNDVPIETAPDNNYRLSVAKPGECAVDWRPVENTVPVCEKLLGKRPPGKSWVEYTGATPVTYCLPSPTLGDEDGYYADDNFYAIHDVKAKNGAKCPLGWTADLKTEQCLPPCLEGQVRHGGHSGMWCFADDVTNCPAGYERYRRSVKSTPRVSDGFGTWAGWHKSSGLIPSAWDYCVPSPKEINAVISQNK